MVQVHLTRRAAPDAAHPGPRAGLAAHPFSQRRRIGEAGGDDVPGRDPYPSRLAGHGHRVGPVQAQQTQGLQGPDELLAQAVLEGDAPGVHPAWDEQHLLVLHVHALDGADAVGEVEHLGFAERPW